MVLGRGDDSAIPGPAVFMFIPGMPVVVNQNTHRVLKVVNGAAYTAVDVILDKAHPGHRVSADIILHFWSASGHPAGVQDDEGPCSKSELRPNVSWRRHPGLPAKCEPVPLQYRADRSATTQS